jgi:hypothetical protein
MHDHALVRLVEDITESGRDVVEETDGITEEIRGSEYSIDLTDKLLLVMKYDSLLQGGDVEPDILQSQRAEVDGSSVDVSECHGESIQDIVEDSTRVESA